MNTLFASADTIQQKTLTFIQDTLDHGIVTSDDVINKITFNPSAIIEGNGIAVSIVGYTVVFLALLLLYVVFTNITKLINARTQRLLRAKGAPPEADNTAIDVSGDIYAAIGMSLYLYSQEIHDIENTVLTIQKVTRPYSPWSSKIYGLRNYPN